MRKKNEETGSSVSAQSVGLVETNSPIFDSLLETSGKINRAGQQASPICRPEPFVGSSCSNSQEPFSDISTTRHDKPAQPILERIN